MREANGTESASEQIYQLIGAGTSTLESVPAAIAMVELAGTDPNRCAVLCANRAVILTLSARWQRPSAARCTVYRPLIRHSKELDAVNRLDFGHYCEKLLHFREHRRAYECFARRLETLHATRP